MAVRKNTKTKASKPVAKKSKPKSKPSRAKHASKESVVRGPTKAKATKAKAANKAANAKSVPKKRGTVNGSAAPVRAAESKAASAAPVKAQAAIERAVAGPVAPVKAPARASMQKGAAHKENSSTAVKSEPVATAAGSSAPAATNIAGSGPAKAPPPAIAQKPAVPKTAPATAKPEKDEQNGEQKAMKTNGNRHGFKLNEFVVYPAHGVGQIVSIEEQEVAGFKLELFVINFVKDKMTLRVPTSKVSGVGMRKLSDPEAARRSLEILTGRARVKRTMWSRRAQEYESKINSGDINAIAEVVRDLYRSEAQPEQSYSERQLYEAALDRMMREIAAVHRLTETEALKMIETQLKKNVKRAPKPEVAEGEPEETDIEEAA
jgi:CarD family transcriptional regulator